MAKRSQLGNRTPLSEMYSADSAHSQSSKQLARTLNKSYIKDGNVSSTYNVLCLSHDPAIVIEGFNTAEDAHKAILETPEVHQGCDLLISRVSGAPCEFACPGEIRNHETHQTCYYHTNLQWIEADWLRLLAYVQGDKSKEIRELRRRSALRCWSPERISRLRYELESGS
jgi:hypothetical protein